MQMTEREIGHDIAFTVSKVQARPHRRSTRKCSRVCPGEPRIFSHLRWWALLPLCSPPPPTALLLSSLSSRASRAMKSPLPQGPRRQQPRRGHLFSLFICSFIQHIPSLLTCSSTLGSWLLIPKPQFLLLQTGNNNHLPAKPQTLYTQPPSSAHRSKGGSTGAVPI